MQCAFALMLILVLSILLVITQFARRTICSFNKYAFNPNEMPVMMLDRGDQFTNLLLNP